MRRHIVCDNSIWETQVILRNVTPIEIQRKLILEDFESNVTNLLATFAKKDTYVIGIKNDKLTRIGSLGWYMNARLSYSHLDFILLFKRML